MGQADLLCCSSTLQGPPTVPTQEGRGTAGREWIPALPVKVHAVSLRVTLYDCASLQPGDLTSERDLQRRASET